MSYKSNGYTNTLLDFDNAMKNVNNTQNCGNECLPNCDETTYKYTIDTTELNTEELCSEKDTKMYAINCKKK
jgi:hypothetical protein